MLKKNVKPLILAKYSNSSTINTTTTSNFNNLGDYLKMTKQKQILKKHHNKKKHKIHFKKTKSNYKTTHNIIIIIHSCHLFFKSF